MVRELSRQGNSMTFTAAALAAVAAAVVMAMLVVANNVRDTEVVYSRLIGSLDQKVCT